MPLGGEVFRFVRNLKAGVLFRFWFLTHAFYGFMLFLIRLLSVNASHSFTASGIR